MTTVWRRCVRRATWAALLLFPLIAVGEPYPSGVFLIATPDHALPGDRMSVVLIRRHAAGEPIGVVVNRPLETRIADMIPGIRPLAVHEQRLYAGGDLGTDQLVFVFETTGVHPRNALSLFGDVYISRDMSTLTGILRHPVPFGGLRIFTGYRRWERDKLEKEIVGGGWWMMPADAGLLFSTPPESLWSLLVRKYESNATGLSGDGPRDPVPANAL